MSEAIAEQSTAIATLPPADRAALALGSGKAEKQLRELVTKSATITAVIDPAGREEAHRAGMTLKNVRVGIKNTGKAAREDAQAFSAAVIAEEKRLVGIIEAEETRVIGLRDGYDAKVKAEKEEKDRIELARVTTIKANLQNIRTLPVDSVSDTAEELAATIADLEALAPQVAVFAEFVADAQTAKDEALAALRPMLEAAQAREAEAARLAAERIELERQQAEAAERQRQADETRQAEEARARAIREDEEKRLAAERAAFEEERRVFAEQQEAARRDAEAKEAAALEAEAKRNQPIEAPKDVANDDAVVTVDAKEVVNSLGSYYDHASIKENGDPVFRNADGSRSVFCDLDEESESAPEFDVRTYAMATANQLSHLSGKVMAVGYHSFANELMFVVSRIESGEFDERLAAADLEFMHHFDSEMISASTECITALKQAGERAA